MSLWWIFCLSAWAQQRLSEVRVRLYAVHPPQQVIITGSNLRWKACAGCTPTAAIKLAVTARHGQLVIDNGPLPRPKIFIYGSYRLAVAGAAPVAANYPIELRAQQEQLVILLTMPLDDYVAGVLAGEAGNFKNLESMKAMAVAIRTYATRFRGRHASEGFDFCDTTHCQDLHMVISNPLARAAAQQTAGELLWYKGALATTYYDQHCGGVTAAASEAWPGVKAPYLTSHKDPYCAAVPLHWESEISRADLQRALAESNVSLPSGWQTIAIVQRTPSGRAARLRFAGPGGVAEVTASTVRFAVGRELGWDKIRSDLYDVRSSAAGATFTGSGSGHGVGLCQAGAEQMAAKGSSYRDILSFYYPGTNVAKSSPGPAWQVRKSEHFDALVTDDADAAVLEIAERQLAELENAIGWKLSGRPRVQVFATLDAYRDTTGAPGWVAATTRAGTIRLQPLQTLRARGALESTLRHELVHMILEQHAGPKAPLWLREGLALYFDGSPAPGGRPMSDQQMEKILAAPQSQAEQEAAYAAARARVTALIKQKGKDAVLAMLATGRP